MADKPAAPRTQFSASEDKAPLSDQKMAAPTSTSIPHLFPSTNSRRIPFTSSFARSTKPMASQTGQLSQNLPQSKPHNIAFGIAQNDSTKKMDIGSLMSPPDPVIDSFSLDNQRKASATHNGSLIASTPSTGSSMANKQPLPMSPPVSPFNKAVSVSSTSATQNGNDPVLYPADESMAQSPPQPPLFAPHELETHRRLVDDHLLARSGSKFGDQDLPTREEYQLTLSFKSSLMRLFQADPKAWLRKERAYLEADRRAHRYHTIMPAKPKPILSGKPPRIQRPDRVMKPGSLPRSGSAAPHRTIRQPGTGAPSKRSATRTSPTPEPSRRAVAPNREDKDFDALPDYCPPLDSLPSRSNSLKVEWKGQPIDLSGDPHAKLLHPDEVALAGNLRLDCATYLTSKRRIFERRLQCLRTGKEFRKTDAQQACKIDVNKASKLWTAFDRVGWLDSNWVRKYK